MKIKGRTVVETKPRSQQTVDKALGLLHYFSLEKPEFGLSELSRLAHMDKATTLRSLTTLQSHGFVDQHPETKKYRLGLAVTQLARIREVSFPVLAIIQPVIDEIAEKTGETALMSFMSGTSLVTVGMASPGRASRVVLDPSETLPLHASSSGIIMLAFGGEGILRRAGLGSTLESYSKNTPVSAEALEPYIESAQQNGYLITYETWWDDVAGIAAPVFDWSGFAIGAVAIGAVASRFDDRAKALAIDELQQAARKLTHEFGGSFPALPFEV